MSDVEPCPVCHDHDLVTLDMGGLTFIVCREVPPDMIGVINFEATLIERVL